MGVRDCVLLHLPVVKIEDAKEMENKDTNEIERVSTENQVPYMRVRDLETNKVGTFVGKLTRLSVIWVCL